MSRRAIDAIAALPPDFDATAVQSLLRDEYGLAGETTRLVSERDQNLSVTSSSGERFVLKIASAADTRQVTEFQVEALLHLEHKRMDFRVPQICRTTSGATTSKIGNHRVRLVRFVPGNLLSRVAPTPVIASRLGACLAGLGVALQDFDVAECDQKLLWDMRRLSELRDILQHIDDNEVQDHVGSVLDDFEALAAPALGALRQQVIHNDANPANVLIDDTASNVVGFIDFGDMISAPLVIDVAVAAAYLRAPAGAELCLIAPFVVAYDAVTALAETEIGLLHTLVRARLAATVAILHWRLADRDPSDPYRQQAIDSEADACDFLKTLGEMGRERFTKRLSAELRR
jgi:Ser/Thr protein kinase RdoA (MazF antagonist)